MKDEPLSPLKPVRLAETRHEVITHIPVLLPIAAPLPSLHRGSMIPGLAASLAIMLVLGAAVLGLVGARQELGEGRSVHVARSTAP